MTATITPHAQLVRDEVVLLADDGTPRGTYDRVAVHTDATPLHQAFSVHLFNRHGEVLITRRAVTKKTWPGVWSNSCCGHPRPGEPVEDAVRRRVREELGLEVTDVVVALPDFRYRAVDSSGIVENEICPVYLGFVTSDTVRPDEAEVGDQAWVPWSDFVAAIRATPQVYSPWSVLQVPQLEPRMARLMAELPLPTSDAQACIDDVDALLAKENARLAASWSGFRGNLGVDVLERDLPEWMGSQMSAGGKRFRVAMAYWGFIAAGGQLASPGYSHLVTTASALESLHYFALVHDDVMDESLSRRGRPSAHIQAEARHQDAEALGDAAVFGRNLAILLGDLAHMQADRLAARLPAELQTLWYDLCTELMVGQRADLTGAAAGRRDLEHARQVAHLKSGCYTVVRPLELGAVAAGASDQVRVALGDVGEHLGQAFALRDDYLGVWGDPQLTGKPSGDDLVEGKATVILALAADRLTNGAALALERVGTQRARRGDIELLQRTLTRIGVRAEVERLIDAEVRAAEAGLDACRTLHPAGVEGLRAMIARIAWRDA
ncbi:isopentenyl-diphosphate delta-isomerase, type 1 [Raineyella antarctica]|uniref:Isopentenyl-diphosphate Delta-isomerase n=1 Tax=Raineyella antarctica TaxID=1577474 RepID=A0A1G6ILD0_9ACTN|nr:isopentenyl-diphosphate Delta-isomerase [Raineyella antarctica]SDC07274.1 isopentenyl-diphosphate delta-isomerase, type 1 [Raineyella antarctica]